MAILIQLFAKNRSEVVLVHMVPIAVGHDLLEHRVPLVLFQPIGHFQHGVHTAFILDYICGTGLPYLLVCSQEVGYLIAMPDSREDAS
ncbi:hypothetical protein CVT25_002365 [Psilocybe cyanescens]|uniref:Uncharacterized protein n=1 Tax=Psilocybe cyanescens TaxID=93625 RepID=A0A409WKL3_PSICY|nr:hypothetical protein CVT25_002365 [Psilocybe cyanescens]